MIAGYEVCQNTYYKRVNHLLNAYDSYNKATEDLLDTLDNQYNWVDAYDPQDYYASRASWTVFYGTKESVETHFPFFLHLVRFAKYKVG